MHLGLATGIDYAMKEAPEGYTLVIVENGKVVNGTARYDEIMKKGLSDREELNICSLGFIKEKTAPDTPAQPENPDEPTKPSDTKNSDTNVTTTVNKASKKVKTGDDTEVAALVGMMILAGGTICMIKRKKHN